MTTLLNNDYKMNWGPYVGFGEASFCLSRFTNAVLGHEIGIIFCDQSACTLLRPAVLDGEQRGYFLIAHCLGPMPAPPPPPPPTGFFARVGKVLLDALITSGEAQAQSDEAMGEAGQAMFKSVSQWFSDPSHEHAIGFAADILGIAAFGLLFVPGIGEAEIGLIAAARTAYAAGRTLQAVGYGTALLAGVGSASGAVSDGGFFIAEHIEDGGGEAWDRTLIAKVTGVASAVMVLPDFAVGGCLLIRDLPKLEEELGATSKLTEATKTHATTLSTKAGKLGTLAAGSEDARVNHALAKASLYARDRVQVLSAEASKLDLEAQKLSRKLYTTLLVMGSSTFVGTPSAEAIFGHDNAPAIKSASERAVVAARKLLSPPNAANARRRTSQNLGFHIGASRRIPR